MKIDVSTIDFGIDLVITMFDCIFKLQFFNVIIIISILSLCIGILIKLSSGE